MSPIIYIFRKNALSHAKALPLQVLAVSELELLEEYMAGGGSLADLLLERIENGTYRDSPMKNYLLAIPSPSSRIAPMSASTLDGSPRGVGSSAAPERLIWA